MVKKLFTKHNFKGSEIRVSTKPNRQRLFFATAWSGEIIEESLTKSSALFKAKKKNA